MSASDAPRAPRAAGVWSSVCVNLILLIASIACFVLSYTWESRLVETLGEVVRVKCDDARRVAVCTTRGATSTCVTTETVECEVQVQYDDTRVTTLHLVYDDGCEPRVGDRLQLFFDRDEPERVAQGRVTARQRTAVRIASGVVGGVAVLMIAHALLPR